MTSASFQTLLSLRIAHAYYAGVCEDFDFVLPAASQRLLGRGRWLTRVREGVLHVLFESGGGGVPRVSLGGVTLRIGLRLNNPDFANFTDPAPPVAPYVSLYRNRTSPTALDAPEVRALVSNVFAHGLTRATRPVTVTVKDDAGQPLCTDTVTAENDRSTVSFNLTGIEPGPFSIEEDYGAAGVQARSYYLHPELRQSSVCGVVDLELRPELHAAGPAFEIPFHARQETLRYYLVVSNGDSDPGKLSIADAGRSGPDQIVFTRVPDQEVRDDAIAAAMLGPGELRAVVFASSSLVTRQYRGRKKIQLSRNGEVLIEHLPQPGADRADANMILYISR